MSIYRFFICSFLIRILQYYTMYNTHECNFAPKNSRLHQHYSTFQLYSSGPAATPSVLPVVFSPFFSLILHHSPTSFFLQKKDDQKAILFSMKSFYLIIHYQQFGQADLRRVGEGDGVGLAGPDAVFLRVNGNSTFAGAKQVGAVAANRSYADVLDVLA